MPALDAALLALGRLWMARPGAGELDLMRPPRRRLRVAAVTLVAAAGSLAFAAGGTDVGLYGEASVTAIARIALQPPPPPPDWLAGMVRESRTALQRGRRTAIDIVKVGDVELEVGTARAFLAMRDAARRDGLELVISSGFRSRADQARLWRAWRKKKGHRAARPGRSNHQSGRALDLLVMREPAVRAWLEANAADYGFRRTVPSEPWHWEHGDAPRAAGPRALARRGKHVGKPPKRAGKHAPKHAGKRGKRATAKADRPSRGSRAARGPSRQPSRALR